MTLSMKMKNKRKIQKNRLNIKYRNICAIFIFTVIYFFIFFLLKNENEYKTIEYKHFLNIQLVNGYSVKKVCSTDHDQKSCRDVVFGDVYSKKDSVHRLKVLRGENEGFFVTFRRKYVLISYILKYEKDIPMDLTESIYSLSKNKYNSYSDKQIRDFIYNCQTTDPKRAHVKSTKYSDTYLKYTRGESCECSKYKIFTSKSSVRRVKFDCNAFKAVFTSSAMVFSRHCAVMSDLFYSVYSILYPPIFTYSVEVRVEKYSLGGKAVRESKQPVLTTYASTYQLDNYSQSFRDNISDFTITIRNEIYPKEDIVNLSNNYMLIPSAPLTNQKVKNANMSTNCGQESRYVDRSCIYEDGRCTRISVCLRDALMISSNYFDLSGITCGKLGVSLNSWRNIPGGFCFSNAGYCLTSRLSSYAKIHDRDKAKSPYKVFNLYASEPQTRVIKPLAVPNSVKGIVEKSKSATKQLDRSLPLPGGNATHTYFIDYKYNSDHTLHLYFETSGLEVHEIRTVAPGVITHITPPGDCGADSKNSDDCVLIVHTWNSSSQISANFTVEVICTDPKDKEKINTKMLPLKPITAHIDKDDNHAFYFIIKFLVNIETNTKCTAFLYDSNNKLQNSKEFYLKSKKVIHVIQEDVKEDEITVDIVKNLSDSKLLDISGQSGEEVCGCGFNLFCYIFGLKRCIRVFFKKITKILGSVAMIVVLVFLVPVILPFLPFIISFLIKFFIIPLKLVCHCICQRRKNIAFRQLKRKKKQKEENTSAKYKVFHNIKKKKKKHSFQEKESIYTSLSSFSSEESKSESVKSSSISNSKSSSDSSILISKKKIKSDTSSDVSRYNGTSLESSVSTVSTPSVDSSRNSTGTTSSEKLSKHKSKKSKKKKKRK